MTALALISFATAAPPAVAQWTDGSVEVRVYEAAPTDCDTWDGVTERLSLQRVLANGRPAFQLTRVTTEKSGDMISFDGFDRPAVKGLQLEDGKTSTVTIAKQAADENFGTPAFPGRELSVRWCGAAPETPWKKEPGEKGAWMRVGDLWFPVAGARISEKDGLELSTLPLECDRFVNYMEEAVSMNLQGDPTTFWSTSGTLHPVPMSFNGDTVGSAYAVEDGTVKLHGQVKSDRWSWEVRGSTPVVTCE